MPKPYISWSQFWLYQNNPLEYYQQYFVCPIDRKSQKMTLGSIFQLSWCDSKYDYTSELHKAGFTSNYSRIIKTALHHKDTLKINKCETEKKIRLTKKEIEDLKISYPILGVLDGFCKEQKLVIENKFGINWTKERVKNDKQITWYSLCVYARYGFIPQVALQSFNSRTGIPNVFRVKRNKSDLRQLVREINNMVALVRAGNFEKYV